MNVKNEIVSEFEQIETEAVQTARVVAAYYQELKKGNLANQLIDHLTAEFARQWWTTQLGLNEQHVFMHHEEGGEE